MSLDATQRSIQEDNNIIIIGESRDCICLCDVVGHSLGWVQVLYFLFSRRTDCVARSRVLT